MRNWILRDLGDDQLIEAVERNTLEHFVCLPSRHPLMDVLTKDDCVCVDTKLPSHALNVVFAIKSSSDELQKKIEEAADYFKHNNRACSLILGPSFVLQQKNLNKMCVADEIDAYVLHLQAFKKRLKYIPGFRVQQALTKATLSDVGELFENYFNTNGVHRSYFEKIAALSFHSLDPLKFFVGYLYDKPVMVGELYLGAGIAGIKTYTVNVSANLEKELFVDLTAKMLLQAKDQGYHFAKASPFFEKKHFYEELGFKKYCRFLAGKL